MVRRASTILGAGLLVLLAACAESPTDVTAPGQPSYSSGGRLGSGNRTGEDSTTITTTTTSIPSDSTAERGGWWVEFGD